MDMQTVNPRDYGNAFVYSSDVSWAQTIKNCFIVKKKDPNGTTDSQLPDVNRHYIHPQKTKIMAAFGLALFALAVVIVGVAVAAIFFPPLAAIIGAIVTPLTLKLIAVAGSAVGLFGLIVGAAAADKLRHGKPDMIHYSFGSNYKQAVYYTSNIGDKNGNDNDNPNQNTGQQPTIHVFEPVGDWNEVIYDY